MKKKGKVSIGTLAKENYLIIGCIIFFLIGMILSDGFLSLRNFQSLLSFTSIYGLVALSEAVLILVGEINIAIGAQMALCPILAVAIAEKVMTGTNIIIGGTRLADGWPLVCLLTIIFSILLSILVWALRVRFGVSTFVITLGCNYVFMGLCTLVKPYDISIQAAGGEFPGKIAFGGFLPLSFLIFLICALVLVFIMAKTRLGKKLYAIGNGEKAAVYTGIRTAKYRLIAFVISGLILSLAALVNASRLSAIASTNGDNMMFYAIVISILGGVSLGNNRGTLGKVAIGGFMMYLLMNVLTILGFRSYTQNIIVGIVPIVALAIQNSHNKALSAKNVR